MNNWPTKKLGEVIDFLKGKKMPVTEEQRLGYEPYIGIDTLRTRKYKLFTPEKDGIKCSKDDVLVVWDGAYAGTVGIEVSGFASSTVAKVVIREPELNSHFLRYFWEFNETKIRNAAQGAAIPHLSKPFINNLKIPLPPLTTQKQIVERLDKIAEAQKLNDDLIQKTNELFQSLLYKELNPAGPADAKAMAGKKDWEVKKLGDKNVVEIIDGDRGKNYPPKNEFQKSGYCLFLNTKNVTQTGFIFNETDFIPKERDQKLRKGKLQKNDVVLTTRGTVGNSALYDDSVEFNHIRINSGMVVLRSNTKEIMPKFLWVVLNSKPVLRQFKQILSGTAQPQLPITNLVKIKFPLPPLETQKQIVAKLSAVQEYKGRLLDQKAKLKELFDSVLHKSMSQRS